MCVLHFQTIEKSQTICYNNSTLECITIDIENLQLKDYILNIIISAPKLKKLIIQMENYCLKYPSYLHLLLQTTKSLKNLTINKFEINDNYETNFINYLKSNWSLKKITIKENFNNNHNHQPFETIQKQQQHMKEFRQKFNKVLKRNKCLYKLKNNDKIIKVPRKKWPDIFSATQKTQNGNDNIHNWLKKISNKIGPVVNKDTKITLPMKRQHNNE